MSDFGLLKLGNRAGQAEMRQAILNLLADLIDQAESEQEASVIRDVRDCIRENITHVEPFETDRQQIQQVITRAELDAAAHKLFRS